MATRKKTTRKKTTRKRKSTGRPVGRPRVKIDVEKAEKMASIGCTDEEIGLLLGCSTDTIGRRKKDDPEFAEKLEKGRAHLRMSLRRKQYSLAMKGNPALLIWLGKNMLGQSERRRYEHSGPGGDPIELGGVRELLAAKLAGKK